MNQKTKDPVFHFLITSEIVFSPKGMEQIHSIRLNSVITNKDGNLPARMVGRAQQSAQLQFHKRMEDPEIVIHDVVIMNITNLGYMTEEDFQSPPEGMKLQVVPKNETH